ncbi:hypothetical protein F5Y16DRAFT_368561 [Xylariaceae sp. FL0255]|nr:hypothetical protein F5Y16DRAFT_368561 [Xylariaceae sp. FL0255]
MSSDVDFHTISSPKSQHSDNNSPAISRKFACPFFKKGTASSRACVGSGWDSMHRLNEHISRSHMTKNQCNRCRQGFGSSAKLEAHQRALNPCQVQDVPLTTTITKDQLRSARLSRGHTEEEKWISLYRVIFPDDRHVPSPYRENPCENCSIQADARVNEYHQYQSREVEALLQQELARDDGISNSLRVRLPAMVLRLIKKLYRDF